MIINGSWRMAQVSWLMAKGVGGGFKNQEIMEMMVCWILNNEIGILLYQSGAD